MSDPAADRFIVQGFRDKSEGPWRWAHDHPVLRFRLPDTGPLKLALDFSIPEGVFHEAGPLSLAISVNGNLLDRLRCTHAGDYRYEHSVPEAWLHANGENRVAIDPDKTVTPEKLSFVMSRAGFVE